MTAGIPPRGDLRRRVLAGEPTVGAVRGPRGARSRRADRPGRLRLGAPRPRARHGLGRRPPRPAARRPDDADRGPRPRAVRGAPAHRPRPGPRRGRRDAAAGPDRRRGARRRVLDALPAGRRARRRARHPRGGLRRRRPPRRRRARQRVAPRRVPGGVAGGGRGRGRPRRDRRRRRPVRRPRGPVACHGHPRPDRPPRLHRRARPGHRRLRAGTARRAGILLRDGASVAASHARGFTFLGVGSDVSFVIAGARRELGAAREALRDA